MNVVEDVYTSRTNDKSRLIKRHEPVVYPSSLSKNFESPLNSDDLKGYEEKGYFFAEELFDQQEVDVLIRELEELKINPQRFEDETYITEPESGDIRSIFQVHQRSQVFHDLVCDERVLNVAKQILQSDVYMHQSRINLKPSFRGKDFYWHSDFETWHAEDGMPRMRALSCSITLTDNYSFNGPLMLIPGSHKTYVTCTGKTPEEHYKKSLKKQEYGVPSDENLNKLVQDGGIDMPTAAAGSVIFFDCNLMHGSNSNITPFPRTNLFFVFNSVENAIVDPFSGLPPRPEHIASRKNQGVLKSLKAGSFLRVK